MSEEFVPSFLGLDLREEQRSDSFLIAFWQFPSLGDRFLEKFGHN
ncbi:MAG TPA: hypothetical protein VGS96_22450 [Thermoanaerobaculia bacterium]|nr:hypothetical protein [Thermoanaerobaculia bacterium]